MMTGKEYVESIKKLRPNIYKFGRLIEDVTTDPATAEHVKSVANSYDLSHDSNPAVAGVYTYKSAFTGKLAHRWNTLMDSVEACVGNSDLKRHQYRQSGTCQGATCAGWTGINGLWAATYDMDKELGTDYHQRLKDFWVNEIEANSLALSGAITDAKGDRSKTPSQQKDKMTNLHLVEKKADGIVVSGYKIQICGVAAAHGIICVPGGAYREADKDFCVAFYVPRDAQGLTIVETRTTMDRRYEEQGWDIPRKGTITQAYLLFDKVFIPNKYVFMCGEYKFSAHIIGNFAAIYRPAIGACVTGQGDVMIGAAISMARANGLSRKTFTNDLNYMNLYNEMTYCHGLGAMLMGTPHPSGLWMPSIQHAHATKALVGVIPTEVKRRCIEIAGGISETDCIPSCADFEHPVYGKHLQAALSAGSDGISRAKMSRLITWMINGSGVPGCMHGGGSPAGANMMVSLNTDWEGKVKDAERIMDIAEGVITEPKK